MECPICYTNRTNYTTECNHHFCRSCLKKWDKDSCPMCRRTITRPPYPNTRSQVLANYIIQRAARMLIEIKQYRGPKAKTKPLEKFLYYLWQHRVIFRSRGNFSVIVRTRCKYIYNQYKQQNLNPPKILKRMFHY